MVAVRPVRCRPVRFAATILAMLGLLNACAGRIPWWGQGEPQSAAESVAEPGENPGAAASAEGPEGGALPDAASYRLNSQDALRVFVWGEEDLQREVSVQPDGSISFPLVGQVAAAGRTVDEVQAEIAARLDRFIPGAVVTVELLQASGAKIYVMGEVAQPGEYPLSGPLSIVQAISRAGGFTSYATTGNIRVLRRENGEQTTLTIDYDRIASGQDQASNIDLKAGDTIIVPGFSLF
jgi:polysaccharide export outer membrane protein